MEKAWSSNIKSCKSMRNLEEAHVDSFDLTGQTGSMMCMAPEVFYSNPYNEKVGGGY